MATDQEIRDRGYKYIPQQQYLQNPFELPVQGGGQDASTPSFGIPNTNAFIGGGGGGGGYYPGSAGNLVTDFESAINARQQRLNNPSDTFLGFNTMKNRPATEASTTLAENIGIPQEMTMMGKVQDFFTPQSAQDILNDGYQEPRFQPGIIGMLAGKIDNYRNLPQVDQAFIAQNMGYTGPTVFGDNNSGLNKDVFGINTRSAFGNYGEYVDKKSGQLTDTLTKQGGKIFDKYAVDPITGQVLDEEEFSYDPITGQYIGTNAAAIAKANRMNKMNLTKLGFYTNKKKEREEIQNQINERNAREAAAAAAGGNLAQSLARDQALKDRANREYAAGGADAYSRGTAGQQKDGSYNDPFDPGGGEKDGGFIDGSNRRPFAYGGLASIL